MKRLNENTKASVISGFHPVKQNAGFCIDIVVQKNFCSLVAVPDPRISVGRTARAKIIKIERRCYPKLRRRGLLGLLNPPDSKGIFSNLDELITMHIEHLFAFEADIRD